MTLLSDRVHMKATNFGRWSEIAFWKLFLDARILLWKGLGKESFCKGALW